MTKTGKTPEGLLEELKKMGRYTQIDSAYLPGQQIAVYGTKKNGVFKRWHSKNGRTYASPTEAIEALLPRRRIIISGAKGAKAESKYSVHWKEFDADGTLLASGECDDPNEIIRPLQDSEKYELIIDSKKELPEDFSWRIEESPDSFKRGRSFASGKGMNLLNAALSEMDREEVFHHLSVLCMTKSEDFKSWKDLYQTTWVKMDPELPFSIGEDGKPSFETIHLELKEDEYKVCSETNLAFYNAESDDLYPIQGNILIDLCRSLRCGGLFTDTAMNGIPIAQANVLANCLLGMDKVQLIYRSRSGNVKPLVGIAGKKFSYFPLKDFFEEALEYCRSRGNCVPERWKVQENATTLNVGLTQSTPAYKPYICIRASDLPNYPMSVTAYAKIGNANVLIFHNSARHTAEFSKDGAASLFVSKGGISLFDAVEDFGRKFKSLERKEIFLSENWLLDPKKIYEPSKEVQKLFEKSWLTSDGPLSPLLDNMGAKRREKALVRLESISSGKLYNAADLYCRIVDLANCSLHAVIARKQESLFAELMDKLL